MGPAYTVYQQQVDFRVSNKDPSLCMLRPYKNGRKDEVLYQLQKMVANKAARVPTHVAHEILQDRIPFFKYDITFTGDTDKHGGRCHTSLFTRSVFD